MPTVNGDGPEFVSVPVADPTIGTIVMFTVNGVPRTTVVELLPVPSSVPAPFGAS